MLQAVFRVVRKFHRGYERYCNSELKRSLASCGVQVHLGRGVVITAPVRVDVGDHCALNDYVHILGAGGVHIGDRTWIANGTSIISETHPTDVRYIGDYPLVLEPVTIGQNVWIGARSVILPGVTIGDFTIVGAGSVVTKSLPSHVIACGSPCRVVRSHEFRD